MGTKTLPIPSLPLEQVIERIVDFAGRESTKTCMLVSRQFHAGAIRNIYRSQSVHLQARSDVLLKKYDRLFGDQDQFLVGGGGGRHVRELDIDVGNWPRFWNKQVPEYEEDILLQLMEAFSKRTGLQKLDIVGGGHAYKWDSLPLKVCQSLQTLMESSSLSYLSLEKVHNFPVDILHGNKTLRAINLADCGITTNASGHPVIIPEATRLRSYNLKPVVNGLLLPRLKLLRAHHSTLAERQDSWARIHCACEALRWINIVDDENAGRNSDMTPSLPFRLNLSNFPNLGHLDYEYEGGSWSRGDDYPLLRNIIPFFETAVPAHKFNALRLQLSLDQWPGGQMGEDFWLERKDLVATDRSWATLDTILASDRYPKLDDVYIFLKIFNSILQELDSELVQDVYPHYTGEKKAIAEDIKATVLGHFVKTRTRGIEVVVDVFANF